MRKFAYDSNVVLALVERKHFVIVFHKYDGLFGYLSCYFVSRVVIRLIFILQSGVAFDYICEKSLHHAVEQLFVKLSALYGFDYLLVCRSAATWHFQIKSCLDCLDTVVESVPIADDDALKAPFFSQYIGEKSLVVRQIHAVELVVRTHHRVGLSLDGFFKCRQIYLSQSSFVDDRIYRHTSHFLIVCAVMFERRAYVVRLYAFYIVAAEFACKIGVFRHILKVTSAQRASFNIRSRSQYRAYVLIKTLFAQHIAHLRRHFHAPTAREVDGRREGCGRE